MKAGAGSVLLVFAYTPAPHNAKRLGIICKTVPAVSLYPEGYYVSRWQLCKFYS